jgi:hypothetical protein
VQALAAATQRAGTWVIPTLRCIEGQWPHPTHRKIARQLVKALQDVGAGLLLGQDDGWDTHDELAALVHAGLTLYHALRTGTYNVAQYMGTLDSTGTVAVGKRADLVLLYGNPLQAIQHAREPAGVMLRGRWFDRAELDERLLTSPDLKTWLRYELDKPDIQFEYLRVHREELMALADSLTAAKAAGPSGRAGYERALRQFAQELGELRAGMPPEQHEAYDPMVRVWWRAQRRQGSPLTIPGVAPIPSP